MEAGTYTAFCEAQTEYCENTASIVVTVHSNPDPAIVQNGNSLTSSAGESYQWLNNSSPISGATDQTYTVTESGVYSVEISNAFGCTNTSSEIQVIYNGLSEFGKNEFVVYPNPVLDNVNIILPKGVWDIYLRDITGRIITSVYKSCMGQLTLSFNDFPAGCYMIHLDGATNSFTAPIIKK
jgi:hypothetical protein